MSSYDIHDIADRLRRRAAGELDSLDGVWAEDDTVSTHNYKEEETHCTGAEREARNRAELEAFAQAMPDVKRDSTFHVCEETNTIFEIARWTGTFNGQHMTVPACVAYTIRDGRLYRIDHYGDSVQSATMLEALLAGGWNADPPEWKLAPSSS